VAPSETSVSISVHDYTQVNTLGRVLTVNPSSDLAYNSMYRITMAAGVVLDNKPSAIPFAGIPAYKYNFTVPPDTSKPTVVSYSPVIGTSGVSPSTSIVLTFTESVQAGIGNIFLSANGSQITINVTDSQVVFNNEVVTITPSYALTSGISYAVVIGLGVIVDGQNNAFDGLAEGSYHFSTSSVCSYSLAGFNRTRTGYTVIYRPDDFVCGDINDLSYVAGGNCDCDISNCTQCQIMVDNAIANAAAKGIPVTVVQIAPLGLQVGKGTGLIWPEYKSAV